ncbi:hypothetical protein [Spirochaeta isovalerica]|uniref:STAS/SEC14 domain-containing protein n=1 Tax=Spirochaeta isovalerica TaxID=150 RepID=A0A841R8L1_9SPIO|nr:hypothetical protein [Spirochaeta isovalerica]MBB6479370.1 hypothetical protein [Spirochaeta isovalerica]
MYSAHGHYEISVENKILFIEAYGPWNLEAAEEFDRIVREQVTVHLTGSPWAMIARLHGQGIYTPDSIPLLQELHMWRIASGLTHIAIIHENREDAGTGITEKQFNTIYKADPDRLCEERYFKDLDDAKTWLRSVGY